MISSTFPESSLNYHQLAKALLAAYERAVLKMWFHFSCHKGGD